MGGLLEIEGLSLDTILGKFENGLGKLERASYGISDVALLGRSNELSDGIEVGVEVVLLEGVVVGCEAGVTSLTRQSWTATPAFKPNSSTVTCKLPWRWLGLPQFTTNSIIVHPFKQYYRRPLLSLLTFDPVASLLP